MPNALETPWMTLEVNDVSFSLSCIGEGNGNPFQCSCLENPRDGGAWWAAIYGVTQNWTRLKRLSSSSSSNALQTPWVILELNDVPLSLCNDPGRPNLGMISWSSFFTTSSAFSVQVGKTSVHPVNVSIMTNRY